MANFLKFLKKEKSKEAELPKKDQQMLSDIPEGREVTAQEGQPLTVTTKQGLFSNLRRGLQRTRAGLVENLSKAFLGKKVIDAGILEEIETRLMLADVGVSVTKEIIDSLTRKLNRNELGNFDVLMDALKAQLEGILIPCSRNLIIPENVQPFVILLVGVNGSGKTTTIGKLTKQLQEQNKSSSGCR